jgi:hypothetical protein
MHTGSDGATMSVVVQRMVDARCAGVIFTADPVTALFMTRHSTISVHHAKEGAITRQYAYHIH